MLRGRNIIRTKALITAVFFSCMVFTSVENEAQSSYTQEGPDWESCTWVVPILEGDYSELNRYGDPECIPDPELYLMSLGEMGADDHDKIRRLLDDESKKFYDFKEWFYFLRKTGVQFFVPALSPNDFQQLKGGVEWVSCSWVVPITGHEWNGSGNRDRYGDPECVPDLVLFLQ